MLRFGEFELKSGRISPYFFNAGLFNSGDRLLQLGRFYAHTIRPKVDPPYMLFGPAYKGIPLAAATAMSLASEFGLDVGYAFNRKEIKNHGEGGDLIGAQLKGDVVVIDDVITAGLSVGQSADVIEQANANFRAVVIALDRQEKLPEETQSATQKVSKNYGIDVYAIARLDNLVEYLEESGHYKKELNAIEEYRTRYGA